MPKKKNNRLDSTKEPSNRQNNILANFKWNYVINFFITLVGVFLGVSLSNWSNQSFKNESTTNNFNLLYTECATNLTVCKEIYIQLNDTSFTDYDFPLIFLDVSNKLIRDDNFYNVGNIELYTLLLLYLNEAKNLKLQLNSYSVSFLNDKSMVLNEILLLKTSMLIALNYRIREKLRDFNLVTHFVTNMHYENLKELKKIAQAVIEGNFNLSIKDSTYALPKSWKQLNINDLYPH